MLHLGSAFLFFLFSTIITVSAGKLVYSDMFCKMYCYSLLQVRRTISQPIGKTSTTICPFYLVKLMKIPADIKN